MKLYNLFEKFLENSTFAHSTYNNFSRFIEKVCKPFFKDKDIKEITDNDISSFIKLQKAAGLKDVTIYSYYKQLRIIFNYALRHNWIAENPCNNVSVKKVTSVERNLDYSKKYIRQLLKLFKNSPLYPVVFLDLHTGMRKCELLTLKKENFTFKNILRIAIPTKVSLISPKTGKYRSIDLDLKTSLYLTFYLKNLKKEDLLFNFSAFYISNNFSKYFKSNKNKNKIKAIRFADIRHIHASYLLSHSKNQANCFKMVQQRLGHSNIQQTLDTYTHILKEDQKKNIRCLNLL